MQTNIQGSGVRNVRALNVAAAASSGEMSLVVSSDNSGDHRLRGNGWPGTPTRVASLDEVVTSTEGIGLVKIDAQGADHLVIQGMGRIIRDSRPAVVAEFWPAGIRDRGEDPLAVAAALRAVPGTLRCPGTPGLGTDPEPEAMVAAADASPEGFIGILVTASAAW